MTFPADYPAENLKGKPATFDIKVKAVKIAGETKIDDEFAKQLGLNDLDQLKGLLRDQQQQELNGLTRTHMKRRLLDQLAADHDFDVPPSMVEAEYQNIMAQLRHEASHEADPAGRAQGNRGRRRGLSQHRGAPRAPRPAAVAKSARPTASRSRQQEMNRLIGQAAAQYQPKDRERFVHYVQQNAMAAAQLRAPLYEDKVVDFLFSKAEISDRAVTRAELEADLESEEGHVHGPGCGHDHGEAKPARRPRPRSRLPRRKPPPAKPTEEGRRQEGKPLRPRPSQEACGEEGGSAKAEPKAEAKKAPAKKAAAKKK